MAGDSSRFFNAGYTVPKYMLRIGDQTMFERSLHTFSSFFGYKDDFEEAKFIFVIKDDRDTYNTEEFIKNEIKKINSLIQYDIVCVGKTTTRGQAETVYKALLSTKFDIMSNDELYIFNIDSERYNLVNDIALLGNDHYDALFDCFIDPDADEKKWSFCKIDESNLIIETAEKKKISCFCSTGLYIFKTAELYKTIYKKAIESSDYNYYIAPLYNTMYSMGYHAYPLYCDKDDIIITGTPDEYESIKAQYIKY